MVNMANMESPALSWSAELSITPPSAVPESLVGDKILLPQSALEQLLSAVSSSSAGPPPNPHDISWESLGPSNQPQLPDPLTFRLYNPANSRFSHAAPLEFSAKEGQVGLSPLLREALGLEGKEDAAGEGENKIMVVSKYLPKGTYVRLRPLEAGYDEEDWKALLEGYLRGGFTTLTVGEILSVGGRTLAVDGGERSEKGEFRFLIDKLEPQEAVCIVDTDLEVDIEPLSEEQARETLKQRLARKSTGGSSGGALKLDELARGAVLPGEYHFYELSKWVHGEPLVIELDDVQGGDEVDIFVSTSNQHHKPRQDEHIWGDFGSRYPKRVEIGATNIELIDAKALVIAVHGYRLIDSSPEDGVQEDEEGRSPRPYSLQVTQSALPAMDISLDDPAAAPGPDHKQCKNCKQWVPARTTILHESFCYRNNVVCPSCGQISKRGTESQHWHCPSCDAHGNNAPYGLAKHTAIFHRPRTCPACSFPPLGNLPLLALHRTTTCPAKPTLCQFCHLLVPQSDDPSAATSPPLPAYSTLSPLTPHELTCGGRTTNCHLCTRPVRLRDLPAHLANHTLQRLSTPPPTICANMNCPRTLSGTPSANPLRMCATCFGPLYAPGYDPTGSILARRLERKLLQQEISGCTRPWCRNLTCATGRTNLGTKDAAPQTVASALPAVKRKIQEGRVALCVDEPTQRRRVLAERIANEAAEDGTGGWDVEWAVKAVESANGDEGAAREWLERYGVRRGER